MPGDLRKSIKVFDELDEEEEPHSADRGSSKLDEGEVFQEEKQVPTSILKPKKKCDVDEDEANIPDDEDDHIRSQKFDRPKSQLKTFEMREDQ